MTKKERVQKYGEVFTPQWCVEMMCDQLQAQNPEADVYAPETTFLEPSCGEGAFVLEVLRRKFARCRTRADFTAALASVYAMELLADNVQTTIENVTALCRAYFEPTQREREIIRDHIIQADALKVLRMINDPQLKGR